MTLAQVYDTTEFYAAAFVGVGALNRQGIFEAPLGDRLGVVAHSRLRAHAERIHEATHHRQHNEHTHEDDDHPHAILHGIASSLITTTLRAPQCAHSPVPRVVRLLADPEHDTSIARLVEAQRTRQIDGNNIGVSLNPKRFRTV